jgi:hypothetical protein
MTRTSAKNRRESCKITTEFRTLMRSGKPREKKIHNPPQKQEEIKKKQCRREQNKKEHTEERSKDQGVRFIGSLPHGRDRATRRRERREEKQVADGARRAAAG